MTRGIGTEEITSAGASAARTIATEVGRFALFPFETMLGPLGGLVAEEPGYVQVVEDFISESVLSPGVAGIATGIGAAAELILGGEGETHAGIIEGTLGVVAGAATDIPLNVSDRTGDAIEAEAVRISAQYRIPKETARAIISGSMAVLGAEIAVALPDPAMSAAGRFRGPQGGLPPGPQKTGAVREASPTQGEVPQSRFLPDEPRARESMPFWDIPEVKVADDVIQRYDAQKSWEDPPAAEALAAIRADIQKEVSLHGQGALTPIDDGSFYGFAELVDDDRRSVYYRVEFFGSFLRIIDFEVSIRDHG